MQISVLSRNQTIRIESPMILYTLSRNVVFSRLNHYVDDDLLSTLDLQSDIDPFLVITSIDHGLENFWNITFIVIRLQTYHCSHITMTIYIF